MDTAYTWACTNWAANQSVEGHTRWPLRAASWAGLKPRLSPMPAVAGSALSSASAACSQPDLAATCSGSCPSLLRICSTPGSRCSSSGSSSLVPCRAARCTAVLPCLSCSMHPFAAWDMDRTTVASASTQVSTAGIRASSEYFNHRVVADRKKNLQYCQRRRVHERMTGRQGR